MQARVAHRDARGFTLVELLVVVVILSFLAMFASTVVITNVIGASDLRLPAESAAIRAAAAELSLVALLLRLAGVAVLLFGAGFWYLVELREPGRLDRFRLGHFLLLATTYSLFFAVFAVLGAHEVPAWLAVAIAAAISYPLVVLHTATIVDLRFALGSALPLAMLTTGLVVNGVYGGGVRSFVYLGMACVAITVTTLTHPRLARRREQRCQRLAAELDQALAALEPAATHARATVAGARAALARHDATELEGLREWVDRRLAAVRTCLENLESALATRERLRAEAGSGARQQLAGIARRLVDRLATQLPHADGALQQAIGALDAQRVARTPSAPRAAEHCVACGHVCVADAQFCPGCGAPAMATRACRCCDAVLRLPRHLLRPDGQSAVTHCHGCGERHAA